MASVINTLLLVVNFGDVVADLCYTSYGYGFGRYVYSYYCSGYCSGSYGYEYCDYGTNFTVGAIAGIVIGSLIFFGVFIAIIVAVCCSCMKKNGTRGRIVHPVTTTGGISVVQSSQMQGNNYYPGQPSAPPYGYPMATYGPAYQQNPQTMPPPPPTYSAYNTGQQPPPYPPPANTEQRGDEHVQQPPLSTSRDPFSTFNGPNSNLQKH